MKNIFQTILARLPSFDQVVVAVGTLELFIFSWSLRGFFYRAPSYILYMNIVQILAVLAYYMAFALLETLLVLVVLAAVSAVLPARFFKDNFAVGTFPTILVLAVSSYFLQQQLTDAYPGIKFIVLWLGGTVALAAALAGLFMFVPIIKKWVGLLVEQISIFAYLYTFIGVVSLITVAIRLII